MRLKKTEYVALVEGGEEILVRSDRLDAITFWLEMRPRSEILRVVRRTTYEYDETVGAWIDGELVRRGQRDGKETHHN
jgi:hypothetical protein